MESTKKIRTGQVESGGGGGSQDLDSVLTEGATSDIAIIITDGDETAVLNTLGLDITNTAGDHTALIAGALSHENTGKSLLLNLGRATTGLAQFNFPEIAAGTKTLATDEDVLHNTGNETKNGNLTVDAIIVDGKTDNDVLLGDGTTMTVDDVVAAGQLAQFTWKFSTVTTAANPGAGFFRFNNATVGSVTQVYIDDITSNIQIDISALFGAVDGDWLVHIQQRNDATKYFQFTTVGAYTDNTGWWTLDIDSIVQTGGTLPTNGTECLFVFINKNAGGGGGSTNLSTTVAATTVTINSDTGTDAVIPAATGSDAGVMIASDKAILDDLAGVKPTYTWVASLDSVGDSTTVTSNIALSSGFTTSDTYEIVSGTSAFTAGTVVTMNMQMDTDADVTYRWTFVEASRTSSIITYKIYDASATGTNAADANVLGGSIKVEIY